VYEDSRAEGQSAELDGEFDFAWAREASEHELSAHGRSVQRRLDTPGVTTPRASRWKRLKFAVYRWASRR
jgi:hypothetical protein